jgi:hypothetical protein
VSDANGPNSIVRATELVAGSTARRALFRRYPQPATVEGEPPRVRLQRHLGQLLQRERIEPYDFRDDVMSNPQRHVPAASDHGNRSTSTATGSLLSMSMRVRPWSSVVTSHRKLASANGGFGSVGMSLRIGAPRRFGAVRVELSGGRGPSSNRRQIAIELSEGN